MMVLTTDSSPGAGYIMPPVVRPCSCSSLTTLHIGAPEEGFRCNSFSLPLHASASLAANRCCLESKTTGAGVTPDSLISAPHGVVGSEPRMDLACRFRRSWRSSRLPASLGSHQRSLPYRATAWTHATWTALTLSGTMPYVMVRVRSLASAALAFFMHQLCLVLATVPGYPAAVRVWNRTRWSSPGCYPENRGTCRVRGRVRTGPRFHFKVPTTLAPIKYLSSDRIMT